MALLDDDAAAGVQPSDFGGAFGGAGASMLAPFVGQQGMADARTNALINIGAALMQASAPSYDPSHKSLGYALGQGLMAGQQAYQGSMERGVKSAAAAQQMALGRLNLMQQLMLMRIASGLAGGQQPTGDAGTAGIGAAANPAAALSAGAAPAAGVPAGGSTGEAPAAAPAGAAPAAGVSPRTTSDINPLGLPGSLAAMALLRDPNKYLETQMSAFAPTDFAKTLRAQGIEPGTPEWNQQMAAYARKQTYIPMISGRPGSVIIDQNTGRVITTPAAPPPGYQNVQIGALPNGQPIFGVVPVQNAASAIKNAAAAGAIGKSYGQVETGVDANGQPTFINKGALADQTAGFAPLGGGGGSIDAALGGGGGGAPGAAGVRPALSAQDQAANTVMGKRSADQLSADLDAAGGFQSRMFTLNKALTGLQHSTTGPTSEDLNTAKSFLNMVSPGIAKTLGIDPNRIASYDEANKYLTQYAMAQASALGQGTDAKLATVLSGNANTHISNLAAQDVVRANIALERMKYALTDQFQKTGQPASKYSSWLAQANSRLDPTVFAWDSMLPAQKQAVAKKMTQQQKQAFTGQYNWAITNGYIPGPQGQ
ncbi:MAG: hypothetical protein QJR04_25195 [Burkholderia multivorans]|nr:hypothetical protein [Burkholderia multivorans]